MTNPTLTPGPLRAPALLWSRGVRVQREPPGAPLAIRRGQTAGPTVANLAAPTISVVIRGPKIAVDSHDGAKRPPSPPVKLSPAYLRAIEEVERHPDNQDGSDKSWVWRAMKRDRDHFTQARRKK